MLDNPIPLAEKLRPQTLDELVGQDHLKNILKRAINSGAVPSMILWGPPGVGKTTIANIIANSAKMPFFTLSAISAGVKDIRDVIQKSRLGAKSILFIDEIHRFNKGQQDALLGAVEKGQVSLIGATTENPSFEVNAALLSRCQVYTLNALAKENLNELIDKAINHPEIFKDKKVEIKEDQALMRLSGGDGRKLLNLLELVVDSLGKKAVVTNDVVTEIAQKKAAIYDKSGEMHYDIISAFIKSIRGSDPNAAVYYLARMIEGGEDVKFIARRLLILASEDIGNANPTALVIANNAFQAVNVIGYPEARIILSQCVVYLACSAKSNASYVAIKDAQRLVQETGDLSIPLGIRNAPTKLMKEIGYGQGYQYAHDHSGNFVDYEFMPEELKGRTLFNPGKNPREEEMRKKLKAQWKDKYGY